MSALVTGPSGESSRYDRALMWAGHYFQWFMWAGISAAVLSDALGSPGGILSWVLTAPGACWMAALYADFRHHRFRLCERCAAKAPLDGGAAARKWRLALRLTHSKARFVPFAFLAAIFAADQLGLPRQWWSYAMDAAFLLPAGVIAAMSGIHGRLQPWCPWCNWGDGGEKEPSPQPDPSVSKT